MYNRGTNFLSRGYISQEIWPPDGPNFLGNMARGGHFNRGGGGGGQIFWVNGKLELHSHSPALRHSILVSFNNSFRFSQLKLERKTFVYHLPIFINTYILTYIYLFKTSPYIA